MNWKRIDTEAAVAGTTVGVLCSWPFTDTMYGPIVAVATALIGTYTWYAGRR